MNREGLSRSRHRRAANVPARDRRRQWRDGLQRPGGGGQKIAAPKGGRRITAERFDASLPPAQAAERASRGIGWPKLGADAVWLMG